jgi:hypothetical protein
MNMKKNNKYEIRIIATIKESALLDLKMTCFGQIAEDLWISCRDDISPSLRIKQLTGIKSKSPPAMRAAISLNGIPFRDNQLIRSSQEILR